MLTWNEWKPIIEEIRGEAFMPSERLFDLAAQIDTDKEIVEVGSWCGKSALTMAAGAQSGKGAKIYCVDTWGLPIPVYNAFNLVENMGYILDKCEELRLPNVWPLRGHSVEIAGIRDWDIGLLFIDAAHDHDALYKDMQAWIPQVAPGGWVVFHDYTYPLSPDVKPLVDGWYRDMAERALWDSFRIVEPIEKTWTVEAHRCG